LALFGPF
jgi:hypothetical protein